MEGIIGTRIITQVALIVRDIEKTKARLAEFFGITEPPCFPGGNYSVTQTEVKGQPAPDANCLMAFFDIGNGVQLELIQPNGVSSVWQDFLDERGEGLHHIAFGVKDMDGKIKACEDFGLTLLQKGNYGDGGGRYSYLGNGDGLPFILELLESF